MATLIIKQPKGFWPVTAVSFWERFSFYGFRSFLALYMSAELLYSDAAIFETYAALMAIMYIAPLIGGYLADRFTGRRFTIAAGLAFLAIGQFILCFLDASYFEWALILLIIGTGYFKPNIAASLNNFYDENDERRESGFTYYFTMINAGALLAPICGLLAQKPEILFKISDFFGFDLSNYLNPNTLMWRGGFFLSGIVAILGLGLFLVNSKATYFHNAPIINRTPWLVKALAFIASIALCAILFPTFKAPALMNFFIFSSGLACLGFWFYMSKKCSKTHSKALWTGLLLIIYNISFIAIIEQIGSTISLFVHRNVDRMVLGYEIPASVFQAIDPMFIVIFGPLLAILWNFSPKTSHSASAPLKFTISILLTSFSIFALYLGCHWATPDGLINAIWLYLFCIFCALAELCILPVGLSLITKISPPQHTSLVTAIWFMSRAFAYYLGGVIAQNMLSVPTKGGTALALDSLLVYKKAFLNLGITFFVIGCIIGITAPALTRILVLYFKTEADNHATANVLDPKQISEVNPP